MKKYDIAINWNSLDDCYFADIVKSLCKEQKLTFLWVHDGNARGILRNLYSQKTHIGVLIDTDATYNDPEDIYSRICYAVKDSGGIVVNDPDNTQAAINKALMYYKLVSLGISTPYTVVVRKWQPRRVALTAKQKSRLGIPFIIKPSQGYGQKGIIRQATNTPYFIAKARSFDSNDDFLLQKKIKPIFINKKKCWFRVFRVFNRILPCWWDDSTNRYEHISKYEFEKYRFDPLAEVTIKIAQSTGMLWFSTEIAVVENKKSKLEYMPIDYVNDQCDMTPVSQTPSGIPEPIVRLTAKTLVENASGLLRKKRINTENYKIHLK
jgi:hypothetical protein